DGDWLVLCTTWAPRFVQPRLVPACLKGVEVRFKNLGNPHFNPRSLRKLPQSYRRWIDHIRLDLREKVSEGLSGEDAQRESQRFEEDIKAQLGEGGLIEKGIELLIRSQEAYKQLSSAKAKEQKDLKRRAAPWLAWCYMNESLYRRDRRIDKERSWRLFQ